MSQAFFAGSALGSAPTADSPASRRRTPAIDQRSLLQPKLRPVGLGCFQVLPKGWIVQQTSGGVTCDRRHRPRRRRSPRTSKAMILIAKIHLMARRPPG